MPTPFHLAIRVRDLASARAFYGGLLGCPEGRNSTEWVDFDFFGHQLVCHVIADMGGEAPAHNPVDGHQATMFLTDPSGNALEFKAFRDVAGQLFAR